MRRRLAPLAALVLLLAVLLPDAVAAAPVASKAAAAPTPAAPTTNLLRLRVESARAWAPAGIDKGTAIPKYHWLVVQDDTGDPTHYGTGLGATSTQNSNFACVPQSLGGDPAYPANCQWPSIHSVLGGTSGEVVAQGDETTLSEAIGIDTSSWPANDHNPNRSYMISVTADGFDVPGCTPQNGVVGPTGQTYDVTCHVDGFKIDGGWFHLPLPDNGAGQANVTVDMQPYPLPLVTVRMKVWNDIQTNGAYDTGEPTLAGFEGHISDVLGPVLTDWYGNPICTVYQHDADGIMLFGSDGKPVIQTVGGHCLSDADGVVSIPYLGPDRYSSTVTAPNGQTWYQTSTLEGWHDWDTWAIQGWNGYDPEFVVGAEAFPFAEFGFVQVQTQAGVNQNSTQCCNYAAPAATGSIKGTVVGIGEYSPQVGGLNFGGQGKHVIENIKNPLISLMDTGRDDNTVYVGRGNADGTFNIANIPDGDYVLSFWDEDQAYLLTESNVSITNGEALDLGVLDVAAWHSQVYGKVCFDTNRNGKCDPGEAGIPNLRLNLLDRDNKVAFYGDNTAATDSNGNYRFPRTYPLGQWVVTQGYWEQYYTVGVTYQTNNQPSETTVMANGGFVDVSSFNLIGDQTRMDWAVHTYETNPALGPTTGGIVGEVVATTTRNETDARFQAVETYEPGLPGATVHLYSPVKCDPADATTVPAGTSCTQETTAFGSNYYLTDALTGAIKPLSDGPDKVSGSPIDLYAPYTSETWQRPQDCVARGFDGAIVPEQVLPPSTGGHDCLEAPMMSSQVGDNSVGDFMKVNGNYGFTTVDHDPTTGAALGAEETIPVGDYIVKVDPPNDANGRPAYEVVKEEDVNIFSGDKMVAAGETPLNPPTPNLTPSTTVTPAIPPFPCAGANHIVNVVGDPTQAHFSVLDPTNTQGVYNPDMLAGGGSPYEGLAKPLCDSRLVTVRNGRSATPNFHFKTFSGFDASGAALNASAGVPLPGRIFGIVVDDLNLSTNPKDLFYGEKKGLANLPIGIYDFSNNLVKTIESDPNGQYEVILPSTSSYNCPLPAGPCPGIYRFLANDPGQPGHLNKNFNPAYRTIGGFFEVWPGVSLPSDLAPTPVAFGIENPGTQQAAPAQCLLNDPNLAGDPAVPEIWSINKPYMFTNASGTNRSFTINGQGFGSTAGEVTLGGLTMNVTSWSGTSIRFTIPSSGPNEPDPGPYQLNIVGRDGQTSVNGLTFHVVSTGGGGGTYNPTVFEVGPGLTGTNRFNSTDPNPTLAAHAIQRALDAAATRSRALVVVYPNAPSQFNPYGSYYENLVIKSPVKLQGVGPGGVRADGTLEAGTVIDGLGYGTDGARETAWQAEVNSMFTNGGGIIGPNGTLQTDVDTTIVPEGEVILAVARSTSQYSSGFKAAIDGLAIQNGDVMDFVPNTNTLGNGTQVGGGNNAPTNPNQGGGVVALASTRYLQITNNIIRSNAGSYGGAIRVGTPLVGDNNNDNIRIANNRILNNGGSNLAGAIGVFNGANNYEIAGNDLCGNFSAEYGGAISHFGRSNGGKIHDNRIYFNGSYDEGGGVIIAGEPPTNPTTFGAGAGPVDVYNNLIEANLANDDGGGLRFLTAGNFPYNVYNNIIVNNISTHEGGGVAIDNAPNVRFFNNTVMKNISTATASTSNGLPAPAGLSTALNSDYLQATLPAGSPLYSNPLMFNNIFWDNRAGTWDGNNLTGIGGQVWSNGVQIPDPTPINHWDMGAPGTSFQLSPTNSLLQSETTSHNDVVASPTNKVDQDPLVKSPFDATVSGLPWRGNPNFVASVIVAQDVPVTIMGDYHLTDATSPAFNAGAASKAVPTYQRPPTTLAAPAFDIDGQARPGYGAFDAGADEIPTPPADLSITKTDGQTAVTPGASVTYTVTVSDAGPNDVPGAIVTDSVPSSLTSVTWSCVASAGSACGASSGSGGISDTINIANGGTVTYTVSGTVAAAATGSLVNTASVALPVTRADPNTANNSATDTDTISNQADLSITKTDGFPAIVAGGSATYTIVVTNNGPLAVTGAAVIDTFPATQTVSSWTCVASAGSTCTATGTGQNRGGAANLLNGGTATYSAVITLAGTATGSIANAATVAAPAGIIDPNTANNSATDTDVIVPFTLLDNFNRANATTLGANWSQTVLGGAAAIRINGNQALCSSLLCTIVGEAIWNGAGNVLGARQDASITFTNAPSAGSALILKASGGTAAFPTTFIRVRYAGGTVVVETTTTGGLTTIGRATFTATYGAGDRLTALALADGSVTVFRGTTQVGTVTIPLSGAGAFAQGAAGGRIGIQLVSGQTVDNFNGQTVP